MRTLLLRSLSAACVAALVAACAPEPPTSDDALDTEDALKRACRGNPRLPCDAGTDATAVDAAPAPTCTAFTYSPYGACQPDNTQTRTVISATPAGCAGGTPALEQACVYVPPAPATCSSFTYSGFGPCQPDNTQTRTVVSALPEGCTGGNPVLSQACLYVAPVATCTSFTYSAFGPCQPNGTQTRAVTSSLPAGCAGGTPVLSQTCTYVAPTCTSFTYSDFGACQPNNMQMRTVTSSSPAGCTGGTPVLSQACVYTPPGPRDYKTFDGSSLTANRVVSQAGIDRRRVKPYSALVTEYPRVLGAAPASLAGAGPTFGTPPARWYEEPASSAVELKSSLDIAFDGCLTFTASATKYATAPTSATATTECNAMARRFWSRTPTSAQVQSCVTAATTAAAAEPDPRRKWAYACTAVLSSTGFLTY